MTENQTIKKLGFRMFHNGDIILHSLLVVILLIAAIPGWVHWSVIQKTLIGMLVAGLGGVALGFAAHRFLANSHTTPEALFGMFITTALGVLTVGYLYIIYIQGPMKSIGTLDRTVEQTFIFLEFLIAQISGIRLGKKFLH